MWTEESRINPRRDSRSPLGVRSPTLHNWWSKTNSLIDNDPPANDPKDIAEEARERPVPLMLAKEDKDPKELGVGFELFPSSRQFFSLRREPEGPQTREETDVC